MQKLFAILLLIAALLLSVAALATLHNLINIAAARPETISVVNMMIGQGILIICLLALARVLLRHAHTRWRGGRTD